MKKNALFLLVFVLFIFFSCQKNVEQIEIKGQQGVYVEKNKTFNPDSTGVLSSYEISLPDYISGYYFTDFRPWPDFDNRLYPWFFKDSLLFLFSDKGFGIPSIGDPDRYAAMILLKLKDGSFLSLYSLGSRNSTSRFYADPSGKLMIELLNMGTGSVTGDFPVLSWTVSDNLFQACYLSWKIATNLPELRKMTGDRQDKDYPEVFNYLGWCSWEQYKMDIDEDILATAYDNIENSLIPVRWFLVDDGYQDTESRKLISLETHPEKFPNGWEFLKERKGKGKIKWTGLWHAFNGHWNGFNENHEFNELEMIQHNGQVLVKNDRKNINKYFDMMTDATLDGDFDFVKVDVQTRALSRYAGTKNSVATVNMMHTALEKNCRNKNLGLINCMAMNTVQLMNTPFSAVTRVSQDYKLGDAERAKSHIYQSYLSSLWLGYTVFPDHDMFHSSDSVSGRLMAVSKALSCAPIYLSDDPLEFDADNILPLCYEDGRLLKPLAPAVPLQRCMFQNVFDEPNAFIVSAPLDHNSVAVAAYNLTSPEVPISGEISKEDYRDASAMILPYSGPWEIPEEGLFIYDWYNQNGEILKDSRAFEIKVFDDRFFILSPIVHGWSVIGITEKFLSPAVVSNIQYSDEKLEVELEEGGVFVFYSDGEPECEGIEVGMISDGLWKIDVPEGVGKFVVRK